jgi:hypothetical protein
MTLAVVEQHADVHDGLLISQIVFTGSQRHPALCCLGFGEVGYGGYFDVKFFEGEVLRGWETAAERDYAWCGEIFGCLLERAAASALGLLV